MTKQTKEMPIIPIETGEVFLQDKVIDESHCYICKKEFDKFTDRDMLLLRIKPHEMGFCCPSHRGIVAEFMKQYRILPGGWEEHVEKDDNDSVVDDINSSASISSKP